MNETSGLLRPAVEAYLNREPMTLFQIATMRAYLRQWIEAPTWQGAAVDRLRADVDGIFSREAITRWLMRAASAGIDPL